jgi:hypothetical protein
MGRVTDAAAGSYTLNMRRWCAVPLIAGALAMPATAAADQTRFSVDKGKTSWSFEVGWADVEGKKQVVEWSMPSSAIGRDLDQPLRFQKRAANAEIVAAINRYAETVKGARIKARQTSGGSIRLEASGKSRSAMKRAMAGAKAAQKAALKKYNRQHGFTKLRGKIIPNHAVHAARYAEDVAPLADALGAGKLKRRDFAERAISFIQSIPYELGKGGRDKGFRRPLSLLAKNRGDCDSKSTLFLALLKAAHPGLDTTMVYIKGHAFVGLGLHPRSGDMTFSAFGRKWVIAEPVGPQVIRVGKAGPRSKRMARQGRFQVRRTADN